MKNILIWIKRLLRSKVMMFNVVVAVLMALEGVFALLQPHIAGNIFAWASVALATGNAALRVITSQPLSMK